MSDLLQIGTRRDFLATLARPFKAAYHHFHFQRKNAESPLCFVQHFHYFNWRCTFSRSVADRPTQGDDRINSKCKGDHLIVNEKECCAVWDSYTCELLLKWDLYKKQQSTLVLCCTHSPHMCTILRKNSDPTWWIFVPVYIVLLKSCRQDSVLVKIGQKNGHFAQISEGVFYLSRFVPYSSDVSTRGFPRQQSQDQHIH
jgi:hypothetical protein